MCYLFEQVFQEGSQAINLIIIRQHVKYSFFFYLDETIHRSVFYAIRLFRLINTSVNYSCVVKAVLVTSDNSAIYHKLKKNQLNFTMNQRYKCVIYCSNN